MNNYFCTLICNSRQLALARRLTSQWEKWHMNGAHSETTMTAISGGSNGVWETFSFSSLSVLLVPSARCGSLVGGWNNMGSGYCYFQTLWHTESFWKKMLAPQGNGPVPRTVRSVDLTNRCVCYRPKAQCQIRNSQHSSPPETVRPPLWRGTTS